MGYYTHLLTQKAILKPLLGTDANSNQILGEPIEILCKVELGNTLTVNSLGEQETCQGKLYTETEAKNGDIIDIGGTSYKIVSSSPKKDFDGSMIINEISFN